MAECMGGLPTERSPVAARTRDNRHRNMKRDLPPSSPPRQCGQTVCPHEPDESGVRKTQAQQRYGLDRVPLVQACLDIGRNDASPICQRTRRLQTRIERGHSKSRLERITGGDHQPHLIEP